MSYLIYSENFMWKWKKISLSLSIVESLMIFPVVGLTWFCHCCNNLPKVYCHWNNFTMLFAFVSRHVDIFIIWCNNCFEFYLLNFQAPWPFWSALALKGTWNPFGVLKYPLFQILLFEGSYFNVIFHLSYTVYVLCISCTDQIINSEVSFLKFLLSKFHINLE